MFDSSEQIDNGLFVPFPEFIFDGKCSRKIDGGKQLTIELADILFSGFIRKPIVGVVLI